MCRSNDGSIHWLFKGLGALALVAVVAMSGAQLAMADPDTPEANTCNGGSELSYTATNFVQIGDTVHVQMTLSAGGIQGGTTLHVARVRFNLDCDSASLGLNCADDGAVVSYQGNLTDTCDGVVFETTHVAGDTLPNQVVFNYPVGSLDIPANTANYCRIEFDVQVMSNSNDLTPSVIEQVAGYDAATGDGICNTTPPLATGNTNSGSIRLCPVCDDGDVCNGPETCDVNADPSGSPCVGGQPLDCNDQNVCTADTCDPILGCQHGAPDPCDDQNVCTADTCDPILGCQHGAPDPCDDQNVCTADTCDPILGCQHGAPDACDDSNVCTADTCDPILGCQHGVPDACDDSNVCTTDTCDPILGCQHTDPKTCDDNDVCTTDTCDPVTGCDNAPGALNCDDNDVCTTDTCDPITGCDNAPGAQGDCDDENVCTTDKCDPVDGCVHNDISDKCDDGDSCTDDTCDPVDGCQHEQNDSCDLICRTPGFWGTHADEDPGKACSQDITAAVIELAGGELSVCGECITNSNTGETLAPNDAASALETLCVKVQGQQERQLARQLLSAALNCVISGAGNTCGGTNVIDWATCNAVCQGTSSAFTVGQCISSIDAFNNGVGTGCHDRSLPLDTIFPGGTRCTTPEGAPKQGSAGSSAECNAAKGTNCTGIQPGEASCTTDSCP
jgi:hypothetical protein